MVTTKRFWKSSISDLFSFLFILILIMSRAMKNIKLLDCVIEHWFIYEFIFSTWLIETLFIDLFSCFNAQPHTYGHVLFHLCLFLGKSWLQLLALIEFFEILWWDNDIKPSPDELAKWQHLLGEFPSCDIVTQCDTRMQHGVKKHEFIFFKSRCSAKANYN